MQLDIENLKKAHQKLREDLEAAYEKELFEEMGAASKLREDKEHVQVELEDKLRTVIDRCEDEKGQLKREFEAEQDVCYRRSMSAFRPRHCAVLF